MSLGGWYECNGQRLTKNYRRFTSVLKVYESGQSRKMGSSSERDSV